MPKIGLSGKAIVITGASSGIGRATAIECARAGMPVLVAARREDRLVELVEQIRTNGGAAEYAIVDVVSQEQCAAMIAKAREAFGGVYAVFANAGYGEEIAMHEMSDNQLRRMFEVNFFGSLNAIRPALSAMIERRSGHAIMCSSCVSKLTLPFYGAYAATKAAQNHVGRAMRLELEPFGVHVSTVHPVGTKTEFFDVAKERSGSAPLVEHSPERFLQPADRVARAVVKCLYKPRAEVWTSPFVRLGMAIAMPIPHIADAALRRMVRRRLDLRAQPVTSRDAIAQSGDTQPSPAMESTGA